MVAQKRLPLFLMLLLAISLAAEAPKRLRLFVGESKVLEADHPKKMVLGNKEVADVSLLSTSEILLNAKAEGQTSLMVWPQEGHSILEPAPVSSTSNSCSQFGHLNRMSILL